jgi:tRNA nucleotidyltransferase (CCA-adding enzyme)
VKELTIFQVLTRLKELLREKVNPRRTARELMSAPVKTIAADSTLVEARELLVKYNVNAMPVMRDGRMIGIISRRVVEKALFHDLGELPVTEYMYTEFLRATPDTPLAEIREYIVGHNRRFIPVFEGDDLVGAVTRTDLLRFLEGGATGATGEGAVRDLDGLPAHTRGLETLMIKSLSPKMLQLLRDLGGAGDEINLPVYAVGGFVRDLLLGNENSDMDITVEGDGILFAETFARQYGCRVRSHRKFGTAVLIFDDGFKVDVASTRLEYYETPAALPVVERSSLRMDLSRRDFTVNTLALRLNTPVFGTLVDFFGAQRDLRDRTIRVLHNLSFVEDPTRVFRAVRFEQRLRFRISPHTESLIRNAVKMNFLDKLGGKRLLTELIIILREKEPLQAVERMNSLGLLRFIHPQLQYDAGMQRILAESRVMIDWFQLLYLKTPPLERWVVYFLGMAADLTPEEFQTTAVRLALVEQNRHKLCEARQKGEEVLAILQRHAARRKPLANSDLYRLLHDLRMEVILHLMARTTLDDVRRSISTYVTHLREVTCLLTGRDLKKLKVPEGPLYARILEEIRAARLNGLAKSREDEIRIVERVWGKDEVRTARKNVKPP